MGLLQEAEKVAKKNLPFGTKRQVVNIKDFCTLPT